MVPEKGSGLHPEDIVPADQEVKPDVTHSEMNEHLMRLNKKFGRMQGKQYRVKTTQWEDRAEVDEVELE